MAYLVDAVRTRDPVATDDFSAGYRMGERWINTADNKLWVCINPANGGAVWVEITNTGLPPGETGGAPTNAAYLLAVGNGALTNAYTLPTIIGRGAIADRPETPPGNSLYYVIDTGLKRWTQYTGSVWIDLITDWDYLGNKPLTFPPSAHNHDTEIGAAITAHEGAVDPHPIYTLQATELVTALAIKVNLAGQLGGSVSAPDIRGVRETAGPTLLAIGAVADGQYLRRSAGNIIGDTPAAGGGSNEPWEGKVHALWGNGSPCNALFAFQNTAVSVAQPTPTNIGTTVGRLVLFRFKTALTVANLRFFGLAAVANIYTAAIYNAATGSRVWTATLNLVAGWNVLAAPMTLAADTPYWFGLGANAVGTTAGFRTPASPIANSLGLVSLPGNLNLYGANRFAQVALTAGAWPATLPALAAAAFASAGANGTLPIFFADAS